MAKYKCKFLVFTTRPKQMMGFRHTVAQINVSDYTKPEAKKVWEQYCREYPEEFFLSHLTETNQEYREFKEDPKPHIDEFKNRVVS